MKAVVLLLLLNSPNGDQHIISQSAPMAFSQCDALQRAIWNMPVAANPDAYMSADGMVSRYDAACVEPSKV